MEQMRHSGYLLPSVLTGYLWWKGRHPGLPGLSCPLRALTGIPCPTCFLTRSTAEALQGDLGQAFVLHAFGPPLAAILLIWSVWAIRRRRLVPPRLPAWPLGAVTLGLLAYWGLRLLLQFGLGTPAFPGLAAIS